MVTYELIQKRGGAVEAIQCLICGRISHNPNDVAQLFCGNCRVFHRGLELPPVGDPLMRSITDAVFGTGPSYPIGEAIRCAKPEDAAAILNTAHVERVNDPAARVGISRKMVEDDRRRPERDPAEVAAERQFLGVVEEELNRCLGFGGALTMGSSIARAADGVLTMDKLIETYRQFFEHYGERVWWFNVMWRCPMCRLWGWRELEACEGCRITRGAIPVGKYETAMHALMKALRHDPDLSEFFRRS